jgi:transcriptional regulator with XRE-family HTH domain
MTMDAEELRELRKLNKLTQSDVAELVGLSGAYVGELERREKKIDARLGRRINDVLRTRIDIAYSEALAGWTVSVTSPVSNGRGTIPGRRHVVVAKYDTLGDAETRANDIRDRYERGARIVIYPRREPLPSTTNDGRP